MLGIVVVAHGDLAEALLTTARLIVPNDVPAIAVSVPMAVPEALGSALETASKADTFDIDAAPLLAFPDPLLGPLRDAVESLQTDPRCDGVLLLTDMLGGTPSNVGLMLHNPDAVEMVTGVNLPMMIKALQLAAGQMPLALLGQRVKATGIHSLAVVGDSLGGVKYPRKAG